MISDDLNNFSVELSALGLADEAEAAALKASRSPARAWPSERTATPKPALWMKEDRAAQQRYPLKSLELRKQEGGPEMLGIYLDLETASDETSAILFRQVPLRTR